MCLSMVRTVENKCPLGKIDVKFVCFLEIPFLTREVGVLEWKKGDVFFCVEFGF